MKRYYEDADKITFDRAGVLVERYIREYRERRTRVTGKQVADTYDIEPTQHNLVRLCDALNHRLDIARESGSKSTQFKMP